MHILYCILAILIQLFVYVCICLYSCLYHLISLDSRYFLGFLGVSDPAPACKAAGSFSLTWLNEQAHQMVPNAKNLDLKNLKINLHVCQTSQSLGLFLSNWDGKHVTNTGRMRKILEDLGTFIPFHTADQNPHKYKIIQIYLLLSPKNAQHNNTQPGPRFYLQFFHGFGDGVGLDPVTIVPNTAMPPSSGAGPTVLQVNAIASATCRLSNSISSRFVQLILL